MSYLGTQRWAGGFGDIAPQQIVGAGQAVAGSGVAVASASGTLAPIAASVGVSVPVLGAILGAGIMAAGLAIDLIMNSGCGQTCIISTQFANQANAALQQNIEAYFSLPTPRPRSSQIAAVSNFDVLWNWLGQPQQCGNPQLGTAGQKCITDRQSGACVWTQPAASVPPWGIPAAGQCWNWFNGYRDPIANDTNVYDDSAQVQAAAAGAAGSDPTTAVLNQLAGGISALPAWVPLVAAGLVVAGLVMR